MKWVERKRVTVPDAPTRQERLICSLLTLSSKARPPTSPKGMSRILNLNNLLIKASHGETAAA